MAAARSEFLILGSGRFRKGGWIKGGIDRTQKCGCCRMDITDPLNLERVPIDVDHHQTVQVNTGPPQLPQFPTGAFEKLQSG